VKALGQGEVLRVLLLARTMVAGSDPAWKTATAPWALGAICLRAYVESIPALAARVRIEVRSYPSDAQDARILEDIRHVDPHVVGFTCQPWNYADNVRISRTIGRLWPARLVVHGGPMVIDRRRYLEKAGASVQIAVEGEAEETFADLLRHLVFGELPLAGIPGLAFFGEDGEIFANAPRDPPDLSTLPPVMTEAALAEMGSYILYETARGCPYRCAFCNWGSQRTKLRARSRAVIEHDLAAILAAPGVNQLWLTDSGLDASIDHVTFVADAIRRHRQRKIGVTGYVFLLHQDLSYVPRLLGGLDQIQVGLQTANNDTLSEIGRKALSVKRFDRILDAVLPHYPNLRVDLLYGLPHIGPRELQDSVRFLLDRRIWLFNLFRLVAIPGTEIAENKAKYGLVAEEDYPFTVHASDGCSSEDMFEMEQFKANMAALRYVLVDGGYQEARRVGVDLVDFAASLHRLVPDLNRMVPYASDADYAPGPELVAALLAAATAYAPDDEARQALRELIRSRLAAFEASAAPTMEVTSRFVASRVELKDSGHSPAATASGRARVVRIHGGGRAWTLVIEDARPGANYFEVRDGIGLYYTQAPGTGRDDARDGAVLRALLKRLPPPPAGAAAEAPEDLAARLARISMPGLRIEVATPPGAAAGAPASPAGATSRSPTRLPLLDRAEGGTSPRP
jgi:hypothetical protein